MREVRFYFRQLWKALRGQTAGVVVTDCVFTNCGPLGTSGDVMYRQCTFVDGNEKDQQSVSKEKRQ